MSRYTWFRNSSIINEVSGTTYTASQSGDYKVQVAKDGCSKTSASFFLTVNARPIADAGGDKSITLPMNAVVLNGNGYDSDGSIVSYRWTQISGAEVSIGNLYSKSITLTNLNGGTYVFQLEVMDDFGDTSLPDEVTVQVSYPLNNFSYVREIDVFKEGVKNESDLTPLQITAGEIGVSVAYVDDMARPLQHVGVQQSPSGQDIVQPIVYDKYGIESVKYLPYVSTESNGYGKTNPTQSLTGDYMGSIHHAFYTNGLEDQIADDEFPYSHTIIEPSPLNRVIKQGAPGEDWQPDTLFAYASTDHTIKFTEGNNTAADSVLRWRYIYPTAQRPFGAIEAGDAANPLFYQSHTLIQKKTKDEHQNEVIKYFDGEGKMVLKRVQAVSGSVSENTGYAGTYYIYDDLGNLVCVIPPQATHELWSKYFHAGATAVTQEAFLRAWAFRYTYDGRRRPVMKQVPGADPVYMVYDSRNRLVLTQDGNQRIDGSGNPKREWYFIKYDQFNRQVLSGIYVHGSYLTREQMQEEVTAFYDALTPASNNKAWYETYTGTPSTLGYSNKSFPVTTPVDSYVTATYYDHYDFKNMLNDSRTGFSPSHLAGQRTSILPKPLGMETGAQVRVLGTSTFLWSVHYVDKKYRGVQTKSLNYLGGVDVATQRYDFSGKVLETKTTHDHSGTVHDLRQRWAYDHTGRVTNIWHQVDGGPEILLSSYAYNELGQLVVKKLHSEDNGVHLKQHVDYRYNIRGWLTRINDSDLGNTDGGPRDYFGMNLLYNENDPDLNNNGQYDGNISATKWSTNLGMSADFSDEPTALAYTYSYDPMSRLKSAVYHTFQTSSWSTSAAYAETGLNYDLNGNIESLSRTGKNGMTTDALTYGYEAGTVHRSNKLLRVTDDYEDIRGFKDGNTSGDDYTYDANGNMIQDKNKDIASIAYNCAE